MSNKESFILDLMKNNPAKELTLFDVVHKIMRMKKVTEYTEIDVAGIALTLQALSEQGKLYKRMKKSRNFWNDVTEEPVFYWVG